VTNAVAQVKPQLITGLESILDAADDDELDAAVFFADVLHRLRNAQDEPELIDVFVLLSTTAFQGFTLKPNTIAMIDQVLATAEQIAATFATPTDDRH
jgi:hypothetical protein